MSFATTNKDVSVQAISDLSSFLLFFVKISYHYIIVGKFIYLYELSFYLKLKWLRCLPLETTGILYTV